MGFTAHESKTDPADPQRGAEPAAPAGAGKRSCLCGEMVGEEGGREGAARLASGPALSHFGAKWEVPVCVQ